jgi:N-formylglutamate amidohydrolase
MRPLAKRLRSFPLLFNLSCVRSGLDQAALQCSTQSEQQGLKALRIGGERRGSAIDPPFEVLAPTDQTLPFIFSSPHSGRVYPKSFLQATKLDGTAIRRSEDSFVDEIFGAAPSFGAPLLKAHFPRAFIDPNREAYELDQAMFDSPLPQYVNTRSPRVLAGLGTIARVVRDGAEIYTRKLSFQEALSRIDTYYKPYHATLRKLLEETHRKFNYAVLIDCHSMPSVGGPLDQDIGSARPDIVLGDRFGSSCARRLTDTVERVLLMQGFVVVRNNPYAGGYTTEHYGRPHVGLHTLQIEINRALYMDEDRMERTAGLKRITTAVTTLMRAVTEIDWRFLQTAISTGQAAQ